MWQRNRARGVTKQVWDTDQNQNDTPYLAHTDKLWGVFCDFYKKMTML